MPNISSVVIVVVDALKREVFYNLLADRELPGFCEAFADGTWVRYGTTVYPTETLPAQSSLFTGLEVRRHGIVGNGWLDRSEEPAGVLDFGHADTAAGVFGYRLFGWPTILLPLKDREGLVNNRLYPGAGTLYEQAAEHGLTSTVIFNHISRGCTRWVRPSRRDVMYYALSTKGFLDFKRIDIQTWIAAERSLKRDGFPGIFTLYFSGLDAWGHHTGAQGQAAYLKEAVDPCITSLLRHLDATGRRASTRFALCSDHGQAWLRRARMITFGELSARLAEAGFTVFTGDRFRDDCNCYMSVIGGCAQFYLKKRGADTWSEPPGLENGLMPLAAALADLCARTGQAQQLEPAADAVILVRESPERGYLVYRKGELVDPESFFWEKLDRYPRALKNIYGLNCGRSGDVVMFSGSENGCFISDSPYARTHGGLALEDTGIPIIFSGPGVPRRVVEQASIIDIAPTVLSFFGIEPAGMDGDVIKFSDA